MWDVLSMKKANKQLNNMTYTDYFYRLSLMAKCVFEWQGLPNGIDEKWIENFLFTEGHCMFFKDSRFGYMVAKCNVDDCLNFYDEPTKLRPYGTNYTATQSYKNNKECVLIRNNDDMLPTRPTIRLYALRLAEITRTMDVNIIAQKTPTLIVGSEKQRKTMQTIYDQWSENSLGIFGDKELSDKPLIVLKTDAPIVFPQLRIEKNSIWNECMTFLGVNNANQDKRERLVADEVDANNSQIELSASVMLKSRERACTLINELFPDCNVSVRLRNQDEIESIIKGGVDNEQ